MFIQWVDINSKDTDTIKLYKRRICPIDLKIGYIESVK